MTDSLRLSVPDLDDPAQREAYYGVAAAALDVDGYDPFNEQARLDVASGRRSPVLATLSEQDDGGDDTGSSGGTSGRPVGAAILGRGELDFVIDPLFRGKGYGEAALRGLLATARGTLTAWSHGDHPAARLLAERHGFVAERTLLHLVAPLDARPPDAPGHLPDGYTIGPMRVGADDDEWVRLNARIFDTHPEQGRLTVDDLRARQQEPWFRADDVLMLRDESGRLVGYDWLKVEATDGETTDGEIYVLGVDPALAGRGLGRILLSAGLRRLVDVGCNKAGLYVEADNEAAVRLYRTMGFTDDTIDVQYRRAIS